MGYTSRFTVYDDATDGGLGKDPTVNYTGTDGLAAATRQWRCEDFDTLTLYFVLVAGTAPTSIEYLLETSNTGVGSLHGGTAADVAVWGVAPVLVVGAGSETSQETIRSITWAVAASSDGSHSRTMTISAKKFRVRAKRTGGAADTRLRIDAMLATRGS